LSSWKFLSRVLACCCCCEFVKNRPKSYLPSCVNTYSLTVGFVAAGGKMAVQQWDPTVAASYLPGSSALCGWISPPPLRVYAGAGGSRRRLLTACPPLDLTADSRLRARGGISPPPLIYASANGSYRGPPFGPRDGISPPNLVCAACGGILPPPLICAGAVASLRHAASSLFAG
jgi:hypothetical protein